MHRNIISLYIIKIANWFMLVMPIIVMFYYDNGLSTREVFIIQAIYSISIVAFEIPSGYLADVLGRKKSIVVGALFGFAGYLVYCFSHGFWGFMMAEMVLGVGSSMISGADSAILYDTLIDNNHKNDYIRYEGKISSVGNFAEAIAGITGGMLAGISLRLPFYVQTGFMFMAIPAALALKEPSLRNLRRGSNLGYLLEIVKYSLWKHKILRRNIIFSSVIGCATLTMAWFVQPYFKQAGIPLALFGVLWTILNFSVGLTSWFAYRIEKTLNQKRVMLLITFAIPLGYWLTGIFKSSWAISFILLFYLVRGIATPVLKDYINVLISSEMRATVLSVRNFVIRLLFAITGPLLGWMTDKYSLSIALLLAGTVFFVLSIVTMIFYVRSLRELSIEK